jgi:hypothetical protein
VALCTSSISCKGEESTRFGKVTLTFNWNIQFWSKLSHLIKDISEYYMMKFQTQKGRNCTNTSEGRSTRRTDSKLRVERYITYNWHKFLLVDMFLVIENFL